MNNKLLVSLISVPVAAGVFFGSAVLNQAAANEQADCDAFRDLHGTVSRNVASVTNNSDSCEYDATLAVYDSPQEPETIGWIEAQKLIGSKSVTVKPGETVEITVDGNGPSCWNQSDLFRGTEVLTPPVYRDAIDTDVYKDSDNCVVCTPTPTPGNSTGGNSTPTSTSTSTPTTTTLAKTGDQVLTFAFIIAGIVSLISGFFLKKAEK